MQGNNDDISPTMKHTVGQFDKVGPTNLDLPQWLSDIDLTGLVEGVNSIVD